MQRFNSLSKSSPHKRSTEASCAVVAFFTHCPFSSFCYSFDLRQQSLDDQGKIWASESNAEMARAQLFTNSEPTAVLALHGVTREDAGTYRCRVDFKRSPTRYRKIALDVIGK